ncbi:MAG: hypothetical protein RL033_1413 [Pseudomonadota bacterium]
MRRVIRRSGVLVVLLLPLAGCLDWLDVVEYTGPERGPSPPVVTPPTRAPLCGVQNLAAVVVQACAQERGLCEQWQECGVPQSFEDCVLGRETRCREQARFALEAGSCFLPQAFTENSANGCYESWQQLQGACLLPTLELLTVAAELCQLEWTPGTIGEGETCTYATAGCAAPDVPDQRSSCSYATSTDIAGGVCTWVPDLERGAPCDPGGFDYCNRIDGCLSSGVCGQRHELGASCAADNDCASNLCASGSCTDPEGFSCAERSCPILWSCEDERCTRVVR